MCDIKYSLKNARADNRLCQLEALRFKLNRKTLEILYIYYIQLIVEYSDVAFDNISDGDNTRLERIQKRAGKIVSGAIKGTAYATILSELGWESLQARRERRKLVLFADINCEIGQTSVNSTHELKLLDILFSHPQLTIGTPQTRQLKI